MAANGFAVLDRFRVLLEAARWGYLQGSSERLLWASLLAVRNKANAPLNRSVNQRKLHWYGLMHLCGLMNTLVHTACPSTHISIMYKSKGS